MASSMVICFSRGDLMEIDLWRGGLAPILRGEGPEVATESTVSLVIAEVEGG